MVCFLGDLVTIYLHRRGLVCRQAAAVRQHAMLSDRGWMYFFAFFLFLTKKYQAFICEQILAVQVIQNLILQRHISQCHIAV